MWRDDTQYRLYSVRLDEAKAEVNLLNAWSRHYVALGMKSMSSETVKMIRNKHYRAYSAWGSLYEWGVHQT